MMKDNELRRYLGVGKLEKEALELNRIEEEQEYSFHELCGVVSALRKDVERIDKEIRQLNCPHKHQTVEKKPVLTRFEGWAPNPPSLHFRVCADCGKELELIPSEREASHQRLELEKEHLEERLREVVIELAIKKKMEES